MKCKYLQGIQLAENYATSDEEDPDVMLGLDYYWSFITGRVRRQEGKPIAVESILGWILQVNSPEKSSNPSHVTTLTCITMSEAKEINQQLKRFWEIEEIEKSEDSQWSKEDTEVHNAFKDSITHEHDKKYQVRLPVKEDISSLLNNKTGAISRYNSLQIRLKKNPDLGVKYREVMKEYLDNGFAEKITEEVEPKNCFYSPHHPVVKDDRTTTKCRPVFDSSAHDVDSKSLNHFLFKGPPLQPQLNAILMRFRLHPVAFTADVKKMFLMLKIHPEDRNLLRFIWEDPLDGSLTLYRHTVLPFGLKSSPYLAIATVHHHVSQYSDMFPHIVTEFLENTYMDDLLSGAKSPEEGIKMYEISVKIMTEAGMTLHKWTSNHPLLVERFKMDEVGSADDQKELLLDDQKNPSTAKSVLGIRWNSSEDYFTFQGEGIIKEALRLRPSKRNILKVAGKLYDPSGFLSPYIIQVKILIQMLWERGLEWDEGLPLDLQTKWEEWTSELHLLSQIKIPRYIGSIYKQYARPLEIHTFGDASEVAYAAVSYLKSVDEGGTSYITLLHSKTKVAPIKLVSLPRLELLASVLAARTAAYVTSSLKIPDLKIYMWTDAKVALQWIRGSSRQYKTFVGNRTELIQHLTEPSSWRWCPGEQNPADIPSRGCTISTLLDNEFWWNGPAWLKAESDAYPSFAIDNSNLDAVKKEIKLKYSNTCLVTSTTNSQSQIETMTISLIDPKKYSRFKSLITTTAYVKRYLHNISNNKENRVGGPLSTEEIQNSKNLWLQFIQQQSFPLELKQLKEGKNVKVNSPLLKFNPYYDGDDKLIKMGGRLQFSDLTEDEKHPIILPNKSYIVKLIAEEIHRRQLHAGINHTLICIRDQYWIIRARQLVRNIVKSCFICRKVNPVRLKVLQAPLPRDRIVQTAPFDVVGVDFTGPLLVYQGLPKFRKDPELKVKVASYEGVPYKKMYICLFTCAVTRAVHLELVWDLSTDSFINSFRRFISARGMCKVIYSDNAGAFQKANKDLKFYVSLMKGKSFQNYLTQANIEWKFILECSPWWGGFYERLMQNIKKPLKKILGQSRLNVDQMTTILKEIEAQINSRPISSVSDEALEQNYLTPASFLIGRSTMNMPLKPRPNQKIVSDQRILNKLLKQQHKYLDLVWRSWKEEYLRTLGTVNNKLNHTDCVKVGEIVLVGSLNLPRTVWDVGVIEKLTQGRDGRYRTAFVRTSKGVIPRSVQHLSRLEADSTEDYNQYAC